MVLSLFHSGSWEMASDQAGHSGDPQQGEQAQQQVSMVVIVTSSATGQHSFHSNKVVGTVLAFFCLVTMTD